MTTHRRDEAISFFSRRVLSTHLGGPLHIRRPRAQKCLGYCGEPATFPRIRDFTIADPDHIPLEISIERDFARLCSKCARTFFNEVAEENSALRWSGVLVSVPILWQVIHTRSGLSPAEREARDAIPSPHEHEITRDELAEESAEEERAYIELDDGRTWDGSL